MRHTATAAAMNMDDMVVSASSALAPCDQMLLQHPLHPSSRPAYSATTSTSASMSFIALNQAGILSRALNTWPARACFSSAYSACSKSSARQLVTANLMSQRKRLTGMRAKAPQLRNITAAQSTTQLLCST